MTLRGLTVADGREVASAPWSVLSEGSRPSPDPSHADPATQGLFLHLFCPRVAGPQRRPYLAGITQRISAELDPKSPVWQVSETQAENTRLPRRISRERFVLQE